MSQLRALSSSSFHFTGELISAQGNFNILSPALVGSAQPTSDVAFYGAHAYLDQATVFKINLKCSNPGLEMV